MNADVDAAQRDGRLDSMGRTVVHTDVVGSTQLAVELGDARNADLWDHHDRIARELVRTWQGQEVERTDGLVALFPDAEAALAFALAYRESLAALTPPLEARVGLHRAGDAEGDSLMVAESVTNLARGGQILLTRDALPGTSLRTTPHGHWRLDARSEPVEVFGIGANDAPDAPPDETERQYRVVRSGSHWLPLRDVAYALPAEHDRFVGREADLRALEALINQDARLVSVTGIGGTGKTRLAIRYGWSHIGEFTGGVWWCDLSEARTLQGMAYAMAVVLNVPLGGGVPIDQLGHAIAARGRCLVILDNFEQITVFARETVGEWLARAPEATFVVTTREVLSLPGEVTLDLPMLSEPDAVTLFEIRAAGAKHGFVVDDENRQDVLALVRRLDHLPLAIELAAARARILSPAKLLQRMTERFRLLTSKGRIPRQATLRGAIDWSWDLLSADEQAALAQLAAFEGGFTLEAAEEVLELDEAWPMDAVQSLVDKSLVRQAGDDRFTMLVSVHDYAAEKLDQSGQRDQVEARHGTVMAAYGTDEAIGSLYAHGGVARRQVLSMEFENLLAAFDRALTRADADVAVPALRAAVAVIEHRGPTSRIAELADQLAALDLVPRHRAVALGLQGRARWRLGKIDEARALFEEVVALHQAEGRRHEEGRAIGTIGILDFDVGALDDARSRLEAALTIARETQDRRFEGAFRGLLGLLSMVQGRLSDAREAFLEGLAIHREVGNRQEEGVVLGNLGDLEKTAGRLDEARDYLRAALEVHGETGYRLAEAFALLKLASLPDADRDRAHARAQVDQALRIFSDLGSRNEEGLARRTLAELHLADGHVDDMFEQFEAAAHIYREVGNRREEAAVQLMLAEQHTELGQRGDAEAAMFRAQGLIEAVDLPLTKLQLWSIRASFEATAGQADLARAHLARAEGLAESVEVTPGSTAERRLVEARSAVALLAG